MANPGYVRSTDGLDTDNGSTWALANATSAGAGGAMADAVAGDTIYYSQAHAESQTGAMTITCPGTLASPCKLLCVNDSAEPPTSLATTAEIATSASAALTVNGSFYAYGMKFNVAKGAGNVSNTLGLATADNNHQVYKNCTFTHGGTGASGRIAIGPVSSSTTEASVILEDCTFRFNSTSQGLSTRLARIRMRGGGLDSAGSAITTLIVPTPSGTIDTVFEGVDLSPGAAGMNLITTAPSAVGVIRFVYCKLPPSWSGSLLAGDPANLSFRAEMINCDSGATNYRFEIRDATGNAKPETTLVRSGGSTHGTTPISMRMATTANASYPTAAFYSMEIPVEIASTGSKTITVEMLHDAQGAGTSGRLQNDEIWIEVMYMGSSATPLGTWVRSQKTDILTAAADIADSTETWTTTGMTTPTKQKMSVTFTANMVGDALIRVALAKASKVVYVDLKPAVT